MKNDDLYPFECDFFYTKVSDERAAFVCGVEGQAMLSKIV